MARANIVVMVGAIALATAAVLPAAAHAQSIPPGSTALDLQTHMSQLEDQMRDLTGRIEELNNKLSQLKDQVDRLSSDTDLRFSQLQGGSAPVSAAPPAAGGVAPARPAAAPPRPTGETPAAPAPSQPAAAGAGAAMPSGSAQDLYNYGIGMIQQANYPAAEQAMRTFLQRYPKDPLAGNAQYWLGATYYARKDYSNAATAFAQGYEKYPHGPKAADDLLDLGKSLAALNQKADACKAYARLEHDFPAASPSLKERVAEEKHRTGC